MSVSLHIPNSLSVKISTPNHPPETIAIISDEDFFSAVAMGNNAIVSDYLSNTENVNVRNNDGNTALHIAVMSNSYACVSTILQHRRRVDVNLVNQNNDTALHIAVKNRSSSRIVDALILGGANGDIKNSDDKTPLEIAKESYNKMSSVLKTAHRRQRALGLTKEELKKMEDDLGDFSNIVTSLEAQKIEKSGLNPISAKPLKSSERVNSKSEK